jgi:hypothetical protein
MVLASMRLVAGHQSRRGRPAAKTRFGAGEKGPAGNSEKAPGGVKKAFFGG